MLLDGFPDNVLVNAKVIMDENISHASNLTPRNGRVPLANCRVDGTYGLANNHQVMDHPDLDQRTAIEGCPALHLFDLDLADGIQDIL